ncbi:MAG: hypothetical protein CSB13_01355 [Chloroflexi bacterium]|nr:MAG: hypothetical protein CSB13_01355 [Chloroflexota bacterium]
MKMTVSFTLDTEQDWDLVRWLSGLPKGGRSERIREALRASMGRGDVTLADVYSAVLELRHSGLAIEGDGEWNDDGDEPPDVADNLDRLGL